jgi:elongation factor 1 alpha-like protein
MSRHRSVRGINYDEEYDDYYCDTYGQSVDDSSMCVSPGLERQYMFDRERQPQAAVADYVPHIHGDGTGDDDHDHDADSLGEESAVKRQRQDSTSVTFPKSLSPVSEGKLRSCMDDLRDFVGESFTEAQLIDAALRAGFNVNEASNILFDETPKAGLDRVDSTGSTTSMEDLKLKLENICREEEKVPPTVVVHKPATSSLLPSKSSSKSGSSCSTPRAMISPSPSLSKPSPREAAKPKLDAVAEYEKERGSSERQSLNMVVIGHVDAGKSTLMGHLLFKVIPDPDSL